MFKRIYFSVFLLFLNGRKILKLRADFSFYLSADSLRKLPQEQNLRTKTAFFSANFFWEALERRVVYMVAQ